MSESLAAEQKAQQEIKLLQLRAQMLASMAESSCQRSERYYEARRIGFALGLASFPQLVRPDFIRIL